MPADEKRRFQGQCNKYEVLIVAVHESDQFRKTGCISDDVTVNTETGKALRSMPKSATARKGIRF